MDQPELVEGAPCVIQIMRRHMQDEETLKNVHVIADIEEVE